jgi:hypothetical protein
MFLWKLCLLLCPNTAFGNCIRCLWHFNLWCLFVLVVVSLRPRSGSLFHYLKSCAILFLCFAHLITCMESNCSIAFGFEWYFFIGNRVGPKNYWRQQTKSKASAASLTTTRERGTNSTVQLLEQHLSTGPTTWTICMHVLILASYVQACHISSKI